MECPHPHIQVPPLVAQPLEASHCVQRMAPLHVHDITVEPFEEVGDDKGLSKNESDSYPIMIFKKNSSHNIVFIRFIVYLCRR